MNIEVNLNEIKELSINQLKDVDGIIILDKETDLAIGSKCTITITAIDHYDLVGHLN